MLGTVTLANWFVGSLKLMDIWYLSIACLEDLSCMLAVCSFQSRCMMLSQLSLCLPFRLPFRQSNDDNA